MGRVQDFPVTRGGWLAISGLLSIEKGASTIFLLECVDFVVIIFCTQQVIRFHC